MNKYERLVDDVMALICELAIPAMENNGRILVGFRRDDAKRLIALIAEGPLPGEVGRGTVLSIYNSADLLEGVPVATYDDVIPLELGQKIIALRKEEEDGD